MQGQGIDFFKPYVTTAIENVASLENRCSISSGDISHEITRTVVASFQSCFLTCVNTNFAVNMQYILIEMINLCDHALVVFFELDIAPMLSLNTSDYATAWRARSLF